MPLTISNPSSLNPNPSIAGGHGVDLQPNKPPIAELSGNATVAGPQVEESGGGRQQVQIFGVILGSDRVGEREEGRVAAYASMEKESLVVDGVVEGSQLDGFCDGDRKVDAFGVGEKTGDFDVVFYADAENKGGKVSDGGNFVDLGFSSRDAGEFDVVDEKGVNLNVSSVFVDAIVVETKEEGKASNAQLIDLSWISCEAGNEEVHVEEKESKKVIEGDHVDLRSSTCETELCDKFQEAMQVDLKEQIVKLNSLLVDAESNGIEKKEEEEAKKDVEVLGSKKTVSSDVVKKQSPRTIQINFSEESGSNHKSMSKILSEQAKDEFTPVTSVVNTGKRPRGRPRKYPRSEDANGDEIGPKSQSKKPEPETEIPSIMSMEEMLSQLSSIARDPKKQDASLLIVTRFFANVRRSLYSNPSEIQEAAKSVGKKRGRKRKAMNSEPESELGFVQDSCTPDITPESSPERVAVSSRGRKRKGSLQQKMQPKRLKLPVKRKPYALHPIHPNDKQVARGEEIREESRTELIMLLYDCNVIPSAEDLTKIFSRYGPLNEEETEIGPLNEEETKTGPLNEEETEFLRKTSRAKVVFRCYADAEKASSIAQKYSIFGPQVGAVSFRLSFPPKSSPSQLQGPQVGITTDN